ncbi:hypothetical protein H4Q26_006238 [Puccinia striiformis f. sp. tritici PST-130]|nr:hypothetical protein H4Q26_006238 [Puccinia striiformis f. sp. tritici PST-130]
MTIQSPLNPQVSNTQIPMSIVNVFNFEHQSSRKWVTPTHELHQDNLICHCHDHDSRIQLHHRNERKRCQNIVKSNSSESIDKLDAKSCSKIVAICLLFLDIAVHTFITTGKVNKENPLEPGRFAVSSFIGKILGLFCFNNGQHNYIRESSTRSKLSYIHVQLFNYTASSSAASGYHHLALDCLIFAHINTHDVHFLFHRTTGINTGSLLYTTLSALSQ